MAILGSILLLNLVSLLYTENKHQGLTIITTQLSLLVLPVFMVLSRIQRYPVNSVMIAYISGNLLVSILLIARVIFFNDFADFTHYEFSIKRFLEGSHAVSHSLFHHTYISMHLCLSLVFSIMLSIKIIDHMLPRYIFIISALVLVLTILFVGARSAMVVILLLILYYSVILIRKQKIYLGVGLLVLLMGFSTFMVMQSRLSRNFQNLFYKIADAPIDNNLFYNANFDKDDKFWGWMSSDSINHAIVESPFGKAIRVSCKEGGVGYWPLVYEGREIQYYSGASYTLNFKYKVIKGNGIPFQVGWGTKDGQDFINDLTPKIDTLEEGWLECTVKHTFQEDKSNVLTFINSMEPNSEVDFTDIKLLSEDPYQRVRYTDQFEDIRIGVWRSSFEALRNNFITGYGIGDVGENLLEIYHREELEEAYMNRYNAHNQFLQSGLQTGIAGMIQLFFMLAILIIAIKYSDWGIIIAPFLIIIVVNFFVESVLSRLNGVIFFSFWYSYFWLISKSQNATRKSLSNK